MYGNAAFQSRGWLPIYRLNPPDRTQSPSHSAREEKGARGENLLEVERRQICRIARPVCLHNRASCVGDETLQSENQEKHVIHFAKERHEVGNDIDRKKDVCNRTRHHELVNRIHALVGDQAIKKTQKIRDVADGPHHRALRAGARRSRYLDIGRQCTRTSSARRCAASLRCRHVPFSPSVCGSLLPSSWGPPLGISVSGAGVVASGAAGLAEL